VLSLPDRDGKILLQESKILKDTRAIAGYLLSHTGGGGRCISPAMGCAITPPPVFWRDQRVRYSQNLTSKCTRR
jgi:hypothetical protein